MTPSGADFEILRSGGECFGCDVDLGEMYASADSATVLNATFALSLCWELDMVLAAS